jgi:glycerol uptake facilitator-like aquaporin
MSRQLAGEGLGTALLLYVIVGSGIAAETLSTDPGAQLFAHAIAVGLGLGALITVFQTVSGSHFNPSVTLGFWRTGAMPGAEAARYAAAQVLGAIVGVAAANLSFDRTLVSLSTTARSGVGRVVAEAVATFVLVLLILVLVRNGRGGLVPAAVGAWVASAVFATSSTGFANPAVTFARMLTDSYTGIAPASVAAFVAAQIAAGLLAAPVAVLFQSHRVSQQAST